MPPFTLMFSGWRARLHYWSRHRRALKKTALGIVAFGFLTAWVFVTLFPEKPGVSLDPVEQRVRNEWQELQHAKEPQPRKLARWLRLTLRNLSHLCDVAEVAHTTWESYQKNGKLADFDVRPLLAQHAGSTPSEANQAQSPGQAAVFQDFIQAQLLTGKAPGMEPAQRIKTLAEGPNPPPLANEFLAAILDRQKDDYGALNALFREALLFPDARRTREDALRLALKLKDTENIRRIITVPGWLADFPPRLQNQAGMQLQDPWLQWHSLFRSHLSHVPLGALTLTLFVSGLWYVILILHSGPRRWRWLAPIAPMIAGIASIWLTLTFLAWQELHWNMSEKAPFPMDIWYWIAGVGLREETAKLALFALFLPWLLKRRVPGLALITGAFVGLGFALEENLQYYQSEGFSVAPGRFLSANFMHAAMTGIAGHALYDLLRSRFNHAEKFLASFCGVVLAHGLYDYMAGSKEYSFVSLVLLAFLAWYFLDLIEHETPASRQTISPAAVLILGSATLSALVFWMTALTEPTVPALATAAERCLGILPMAIIYWRRL